MYTLNAEEFTATYNALNKAVNQNIIAAMQELAGILKAHEGESDVIDQAIANCHTLADSYNQGFCESLTKLKGTFDQLFDLSEFMAKKASIGDVSKVDTGFEAGKLDASGVMV
jgi:hypothetical protein